MSSGGTVDGVPNPLDAAQIEISYLAGGMTVKGKFHALAFNTRGGLIYPAGSTPVGIRVAEGGYRGTPAVATANLRNGQTSPTENQLKPENKLSVFPNPVNKVINIKLTDFTGKTTARLTDVACKVIFEKTLTLTENTATTMPIDDLANGIYFLTVNAFTTKIVVEN